MRALDLGLRRFLRTRDVIKTSTTRFSSGKFADWHDSTGPPHWSRQDHRRDSRVLSTLASSPTPLPSWKQEVNRRLAEHKNRKGISVVDEEDAQDGQASSNSKAAAAAARVAARYAKAPSFSEMQAAEARGALRAAEAATRAALEAQELK